MKRIVFLLLCFISLGVYAQTDAPPSSPLAKPLTSYFNITGSDSSWYAYINGKYFQNVGRAYLRTNVPFLATQNAFTYTGNLNSTSSHITVTSNYTAQNDNVISYTLHLINNTNANGHTGVNQYGLWNESQSRFDGTAVFNFDVYASRFLHLNNISTMYLPGSLRSNKLRLNDTAGKVIMTLISNNHEVNIGTDTSNHGLDSGLRVGGHVQLPNLQTTGTPVNGLSVDSQGNVIASALGGGTSIPDEVPSGSINSSNTIFTLAFTPSSGTVSVSLNGIHQNLSLDYTLSSSTITFLSGPPFTGDILTVSYSH